MLDDFAADLDEMTDDLGLSASFTSQDGGTVRHGVPVLCSEISTTVGTTRAAFAEDLAAQVVVSRARLADFPLGAGTRIRLSDGRCLRVTTVTDTPGDPALTLTVTA